VSAGGRFVAVIGPSGSGKSSLVAAGLLPRIAAGALRGGDTWEWVRFTPGQVGNDPFIALADRLAQQFPKAGWKGRDLAEQLRSDASTLQEIVKRVLTDHEGVAELVLFIDQLEELFTLVAREQRAPFIELIVAATRVERLRVVITMRADFYAHCLESESLAALLRDGAVPISPPGVTALVEMITRPAQAAGLDLESGLVDRILADTGTEPGALALMEFLLSKLYERRTGKQLTLAAYDALGGVAGIIEAQGEAALRTAAGVLDDKAIAPVFEALVNVDPDPKVGTTRRRADLAQFHAEARALVDRLADARCSSRPAMLRRALLWRLHTRLCCVTGAASRCGSTRTARFSSGSTDCARISRTTHATRVCCSRVHVSAKRGAGCASAVATSTQRSADSSTRACGRCRPSAAHAGERPVRRRGDRRCGVGHRILPADAGRSCR
jgi:energy-coupling factor transporter ATP-binding protein EcfA2